MPEATTPPPQANTTSTATHEAPSLPTSPLAKRAKVDPAQPSHMASSATANGTSSDAPSKNAPPPLSAAPPLLVKKLSPQGRAPTRGSAYAAGYDLYAAKPTTIPARGKALVDTDIAVAISEGCYGRVAPRSGLASKNFIDTGAGVIDSDYRGPLKVLLFNHAETDFEIKEGDRVAQLIIERIYTPEVLVVEELEESVRGAGGLAALVDLAMQERRLKIGFWN